MDLMDVTLTRINKQTAADPYASMEKDQLISMIHFLVKREDERAQSNLMKSIDKLINQDADLSTQSRIINEGCDIRAEASLLGLCLVKRRWIINQSIMSARLCHSLLVEGNRHKRCF